MIQPHNRHASFSIYICVLALADTVSLLIGKHNASKILFWSIKSWYLVLNHIWVKVYCYKCPLILPNGHLSTWSPFSGPLFQKSVHYVIDNTRCEDFIGWEKVWGRSPKTFCQLIMAEPEVVLSSLNHFRRNNLHLF